MMIGIGTPNSQSRIPRPMFTLLVYRVYCVSRRIAGRNTPAGLSGAGVKRFRDRAHAQSGKLR
jgi:hypothetical protein